MANWGKMYQMLNAKKQIHVLMVMLCVGQVSSEENGPISISENDFVNHTLWFNTSTDKDTSAVFRMEVQTKRCDGTYEYDGRFVLWHNECAITYQDTVHCIGPHGPACLYKRVNRSHVEIEWTSSWKDPGSLEFAIIKKTQKLNVLYSPSILGLFVNDKEVADVIYVDEGQEVKVNCTFDRGNPFVSFYLLDEEQQLTVKEDSRHITFIFRADRTKMFRTIRCTDHASALNASVTVRIRDLPRVTSLTLNGLEASDLHITDEDLHINVTCSFDKGNPPASFFHLLDEQRQKIYGEYYEEYVTHLLSPADCFQRFERRVSCEGTGSQLNRSVTLLARCPPRFSRGPLILVNYSKEDHPTFDIIAHTTEIKGCYLISPELPDKPATQVTYEVTGSPPHLKMTLSMPEKYLVYPGNWILTVANEKGNATTSVIFRLSSDSFTKDKDLNNVLVLTAAVTGLVCVFGSAMVLGTFYILRCWRRKKVLGHNSPEDSLICTEDKVADRESVLSKYYLKVCRHDDMERTKINLSLFWPNYK